MKIERIDMHQLEATLNFRFETSFGVEQTFHKILVIIHSDGVEGYGETTAGNWPGYSYETAGTTWHALEHYLIPRIIGKDFSTPAQLLQALKGIRGHNMAVAALESALWDAQAKAANLPLWQLLGGVSTEIPVGASIGIQASIEKTVEMAQQHAEQAYKRLKFKIKPGWDVKPIRAVREALPDMPLTVDANSAYTLTDARVFQQLDELGLDYIEQPLAYDDLIDHAKLQAMLATPICLDESIHSPEDARKGLEMGSGRVINIKMGRSRGHVMSRRIHDVALSFAFPVWCGGMLELGVGRAHNLHLSSLENFKLPGDTSSASRYYAEDIVEPVLDAKNGIQHIPEGAGLGVTLKRDFIKSITQRSAAFPS